MMFLFGAGEATAVLSVWPLARSDTDVRHNVIIFFFTTVETIIIVDKLQNDTLFRPAVY